MPSRVRRPFPMRVRSRAATTAGVVSVLSLAAFLRFWALGEPRTLVFDEIYYVRDAISQLAHGAPTIWPGDDPAVTTGFSDAAEFAVHPPLGKWIIGIGLLLFGDAGGWGWRSAVAAVGVATVAMTMRLGWLLSRSVPLALLAGLMLAIDGVHVVLSRVGLLDGLLTGGIVLGAICMWRDHEQVSGRGAEITWARPWLLAAGAVFGAAAAVKWSGLYALAGFLLLTLARDVAHRIRAARAARGRSEPGVGSAWTAAAWQGLITGCIALPAAVGVYLASWAGWIASRSGWGRADGPWWRELWAYHVEMLEWHATLSAPHPYQAHPLTWPLALIPTAMYSESAGDGWISVISPLPNPLITWGGIAALCVLAWWLIRGLRGAATPLEARGVAPFAAAFVLTGWLSGWLPWVLTFSRSAVFQFYAVVLTPFQALALALVIWALCASRTGERSPDERFGRRAAATLFVCAALALAVYFFPLWSGASIPEWFWRMHLWLPGWV